MYIIVGNLQNVNFNFLGTVWSWNLTEDLRIKRSVFVLILSFLPCLLPSFFFLFSFYSYFVSLWQKSDMNSVKGAWFIWLSFRGFHLKEPGKIQKGVALGICWEVAYVLAAGTGDKRRGWCQLFCCTLMMTHWLQNNPHLHRFLLAPVLSSILNSTLK